MYKYQPLFEHTNFLKNLLDWVHKIKVSESLTNNIFILNEYRYKYARVVESTSISIKRKQTIINEINRRIYPIVKITVDRLNELSPTDPVKLSSNTVKVIDVLQENIKNKGISLISITEDVVKKWDKDLSSLGV